MIKWLIIGAVAVAAVVAVAWIWAGIRSLIQVMRWMKGSADR